MTSPWAIPIFVNFTLPTSAGPGEARIVIGPDLPPPLDTYSPSVQFGVGAAYAAAIIWYPEGDDTSYIYTAVVSRPGLPHIAGVVFGHVTGGTIGEIAPNNPTGVIWIATALGVPWSININASQERIETIANLDMVADNGSVIIQAPNGTVSLFGDTLLQLTGDQAATVAANNNDLTLLAATGRLMMQAATLARILCTGQITLQNTGGANDIAIFAGRDVIINGADDITLTATDDINFQGDITAGANSRQGYIPYEPQEGLCSAVVATTNAGAAVTGAAVTITPESANDVFIVHGTFAISSVVAPTTVFGGQLRVDGVTQAKQAPWKTAVAGNATTLHQTWIVSGLTVAPHTFQLFIRSTTPGQYQTFINDCNIVVEPHYSK